MKRTTVIATLMLGPGGAFAAAGDVAEGFDGASWIDKWPVLVVVLLSVVIVTSLFAIRIFSRARKERDS